VSGHYTEAEAETIRAFVRTTRQRYYLELDYDWEKLKFRLSVLHRCLPLVRAELSAFRDEIMRGLDQS